MDELNNEFQNLELDHKEKSDVINALKNLLSPEKT